MDATLQTSLPCLAAVAALALAATTAVVFLVLANLRLRTSRRQLVAANGRLQAQLREIRDLQRSLQEQAMQDHLTGLYNRRYLEDVMARELERALRADEPLSLVIIDVDHFKRVNDGHGHPAGDQALRLLAALLKANVRASDIVCRYGGEEFLVLLPGAAPEIAALRAEQWRALIEEAALALGGRHLHMTASFGVAGFPAHAPTADALIRAADAALYAAKGAGRNRVAMATRPAGAEPARPQPAALRLVPGAA